MKTCRIICFSFLAIVFEIRSTLWGGATMTGSDNRFRIESMEAAPYLQNKEFLLHTCRMNFDFCIVVPPKEINMNNICAFLHFTYID